MTDPSADVLIIGAGAAGIAAALELTRCRRSVLILEARERIGGRCYTHHEPTMPMPIELGAEFIHGRSKPVFAMLDKFGTVALDAARSHWFAADGRLRPRSDLFPEIKRAMAQFDTLHRRDVSFKTYLARDLRDKLSAPALDFARTLVEGYDSADPARISAREVVDEWSGGGGADSPTFRPLGGYGALLAAAVAALAQHEVGLQLQTVVKTIKWRRGHVAVTGTYLGAPFHAQARHAIITLPLGVLQRPRTAPDAVHFVPALKEKRAALQSLDAGCTVKVALRFHQAFWEKLDRGRYRNAAFLHAPNAAFSTFWTALPIRAPLLIAWAGGPRARRLPAGKNTGIVRAALTSLGATLGNHDRIAAQFAGASVHDWRRDPYCHGAYSYVTVGGQGAREILASPLRNTLYFAGEATDLSGEAATVGGALQSGIRAARELMRRC